MKGSNMKKHPTQAELHVDQNMNKIDATDISLG